MKNRIYPLKHANKREMKTRIFLLSTFYFLLCAIAAHGQSVVSVNNPVTRPVPVKQVAGGSGAPAIGAAHEANSQVATSTTAGTLVIARATRTSCLVRNLDASINVYIGAATVTSGNGMLIKPGESVVISGVTLWQVIAASGTPTVAVIDEYN
jgi:hypothetical protein